MPSVLDTTCGTWFWISQNGRGRKGPLEITRSIHSTSSWPLFPFGTEPLKLPSPLGGSEVLQYSTNPFWQDPALAKKLFLLPRLNSTPVGQAVWGALDIWPSEMLQNAIVLPGAWTAFLVLTLMQQMVQIVWHRRTAFALKKWQAANIPSAALLEGSQEQTPNTCKYLRLKFSFFFFAFLNNSPPARLLQNSGFLVSLIHVCFIYPRLISNVYL